MSAIADDILSAGVRKHLRFPRFRTLTQAGKPVPRWREQTGILRYDLCQWPWSATSCYLRPALENELKQPIGTGSKVVDVLMEIHACLEESALRAMAPC